MPQLEQTEFFISQLFWLVLTFSFLFIFLWRISLPRISSVLEKRESKINEDISSAKQLQTEAEKIQKQIDKELVEARFETSELIKTASSNFQNQATKKLDQLDNNLSIKIDESASIIEKNIKDSLKQIQDQTCLVAKLALSKISSVPVSDKEIRDTVDQSQPREIN